MAYFGHIRGIKSGGKYNRSRPGKWIGPAELNRLSEEDSNKDGGKEIETGGLLVGMGKVNSWMLRLLCDNPWDGGGGHQPRDIAQWTPDQIWFRLCDKGLMKLGGRTQMVEPFQVKAAEDGMVMGRTPDGKPIRGRIAGKSLARQLMERAAAKKVLEAASIKKGGRRGRE